MIKINLLPIRQLKKRTSARNQIILVVIGVVGLALLLGGVTYYQIGVVKDHKANIASLKKKKKKYLPILRKIENHKRQIAELKRRSDVIDKLQSDSSLTVLVLNEVANIIDNDRMWLQALNQSGKSLKLSGVALDNQTIAQFMDNLKLSPYVKFVNLSDSSLKKIAGRDLKSFSLTCAVAQPKKPKPKEDKQAKAKK